MVWAFLVMQRIDGYDLSDLVAERGPLPTPWVAAVGAQVCSVLATAHAFDTESGAGSAA